MAEHHRSQQERLDAEAAALLQSNNSTDKQPLAPPDAADAVGRCDATATVCDADGESKDDVVGDGESKDDVVGDGMAPAERRKIQQASSVTVRNNTGLTAMSKFMFKFYVAEQDANGGGTAEVARMVDTAGSGANIGDRKEATKHVGGKEPTSPAEDVAALKDKALAARPNSNPKTKMLGGGVAGSSGVKISFERAFGITNITAYDNRTQISERPTGCVPRLGLSPDWPGESCQHILDNSCDEAVNGVYWINVTDAVGVGKDWRLTKNWRVVEARYHNYIGHDYLPNKELESSQGKVLDRQTCV